MQVELLYLLIGNTSESSEAIGVFTDQWSARDYVEEQTYDNPFRSFTVRRVLADYPGEELTAYYYDKDDSGPGWVRRGG